MTTPADQLPITHLRKLVCDNMSHLCRDDKKEVLNYALQELPGKKFIMAGDGTRICLDDSVPDYVIRQMHSMIQSKCVFFDPAEFKQ